VGAFQQVLLRLQGSPGQEAQPMRQLPSPDVSRHMAGSIIQAQHEHNLGNLVCNKESVVGSVMEGEEQL